MTMGAADPALQRTEPEAERIEGWMVEHLARELRIDASQLDVTRTFDEYGLDSVAAVDLMSALEDWLGLELAPNLAYQHPSIRLLARHLARASGKPA